MFSRRNVETGFVMTRFNKNKWKVSDRETFNTTGEKDSHDTTYTGVPIRVRSSLPLLPAQERSTIVGASPCPPAGLFDVSCRGGHPFSWNEKKPVAWYKTFVSEIAAGLVVDLTPGSGALARACLEKGVQYVGFCRTLEHRSWLINVLNRAAVEIASRRGTALYEQDLATCLNDFFEDIIDEVHAQDAAISEPGGNDE